jgi:hypothetical protein
MHTTDAPTAVDVSVLEALRDKIAAFVETANPDLATAKLRIADLEVDRRLAEEYSVALRDELCPQFRERLYYISVTDYTGRNGRKFVDVSIDMKRGLAI